MKVADIKRLRDAIEIDASLQVSTQTLRDLLEIAEYAHELVSAEYGATVADLKAQAAIKKMTKALGFRSDP